MIPQTLQQELTEDGYSHLTEFPGKGICGIYPFIFTWAIVIGMDEIGYSGRYCYERRSDAVTALQTWDGYGDPPGPWIKYKGVGGERRNDHLINHTTDEMESRESR